MSNYWFSTKTIIFLTYHNNLLYLESKWPGTKQLASSGKSGKDSCARVLVSYYNYHVSHINVKPNNSVSSTRRTFLDHHRGLKSRTKILSTFLFPLLYALLCYRSLQNSFPPSGKGWVKITGSGGPIVGWVGNTSLRRRRAFPYHALVISRRSEPCSNGHQLKVINCNMYLYIYVWNRCHSVKFIYCEVSRSLELETVHQSDLSNCYTPAISSTRYQTTKTQI